MLNHLDVFVELEELSKHLPKLIWSKIALISSQYCHEKIRHPSRRSHVVISSWRFFVVVLNCWRWERHLSSNN